MFNLVKVHPSLGICCEKGTASSLDRLYKDGDLTMLLEFCLYSCRYDYVHRSFSAWRTEEMLYLLAQD